jgi:hypothetical protein
MPDRHDMPAGSTPQLITYDDGIDTEEKWSQSWEGKDHDLGISLIHLSTTTDDDGPPLHLHPYPETIMVRSGTSTVTVGEQQFENQRRPNGRHSGQHAPHLPHPRTPALRKHRHTLQPGLPIDTHRRGRR